jgi:hypothetical protein
MTYISTLIIISSPFLVELIVHKLDSLDQLVTILHTNPFLKRCKAKFLLLVRLPQPLEVVTEDLFTILLLKDTVDKMAAE